jgi:hypothetical protein
MLERCRRGGAAWPAAPLACALGACALGACVEASERPGMATDCNEPACIEARGNSVPALVQSENGDGTSGGAGSGNMPGSGAGTLAGSVQQVVTQDLLSSQSLRGSVQVRAPSPAANADDIIAETGSDGMFRLDGVLQNNVLWVGVGAFADPPGGDFVDTLQAVDSTQGNFVDLLVVRRDLLIELAAAAYLNSPVDFNPEAAHLIIRFVAEGGGPIQGVHITFPDPDTISTAYDAGDTYSDELDTTSTRGTAILLNMSAPGFPGGATSIYADVDGEQFMTQVQIAAAGVTIVTAVVPNP